MKSLLKASLSMIVFCCMAQAKAADVYSPYGLHCPAVSTPSDEDISKVTGSLDQRYRAAWGKERKPGQPIPTKAIDPRLMEEIAAISACGALMDQPSCSQYYDPEFGGKVSVLMDLSTKAPVRRQFDEAIAALPSVEARKAAQHCIKLVGRK